MRRRFIARALPVLPCSHGTVSLAQCQRLLVARWLKNIDIIADEDLLGNARTVGDYFETRLKELASLPLVCDVRGRRFMMCVEYVADKATRAPLPDTANISRRIAQRCETKGLLVRPIGHIDIMSPPLILTRDECDLLVDTLRDAIGEVTQELRCEGFVL